QLRLSPVGARGLGLEKGDRVWMDAKPAGGRCVGSDEVDPVCESARLVASGYHCYRCRTAVTASQQTYSSARRHSCDARKTRPDGRALAETGYQSSFRHGSQQSLTRGWAPPMHQTDTLFHKKAAGMGFVFGFDVDNHAINTVPKETVVKITKAEAGGLGGKG